MIIAGVWLLWRGAAAEIRRARARSDFVVGVSHDLRTPVASVRMLADSLYMGRVAEAEKQKQFLATIVRECQRLSQLIERVLFFVRFGQDALVYRPRETDVGALVTREVEAFRTSVSQVTAVSGASAPGKGEAISLAVEPGLPRLMADDGALVQVVLNLLDNAWKYGRPPASADGKGRERVEVMAVVVRAVVMAKKHRLWGRRRKWIRVSVSDHGEGICGRDLRRVFRPFYRAQGARDRNTSGVGLGLALCRHVAVAHGGWIEAESEMGKGASFMVYLPAERGSAGVSG